MFRAFRTTVREHPKALFVVAATWAVLPALALIPAAIMLLTLDGDIRFSFSDEPDEDIVRWAYAIELVWANVIALVGFFVTCALIAFFRDGRRSPLARIVANSRRFVASITVVALYFAIATAWYFYSATTGSEAPWVGFFLNVAGVFVTVGALIAIAAGRPGASRRRWAALVAAIVALQAAGIAVWTLARGVDPPTGVSLSIGELLRYDYAYTAAASPWALLKLVAIAWFLFPAFDSASREPIQSTIVPPTAQPGARANA